MTDLTVLDQAHAAMDANPGDDAMRLRFYERLADSELFLLLTQEAQGESVSPELFDIADGRFVLVFDREDRLAQFTGRPAPYAAMSGRVLAQMLDGQGVGLALNLEVAPSSILIPDVAMGWLLETLGNAPDEVQAQVAELLPPSGLPEALIASLDPKLATARGLADCAYLVGVTYADGGKGHMLAFIDALEDAQPALAKAAAEALTFSGIEAGAMDVAFFSASDPVSAQLAAVGLRFDLPQPEKPTLSGRPAPGSDPDNPPILK